MKLRNILDRDLGADLRTILTVLATIAAIVQALLDEMSKLGVVGPISITVILSLIGRFLNFGNAKGNPNG